MFCFPFVFLIGYDDLLSIPCPSLSTWVRIFEGYVSTSETDKQTKGTVKLLVEIAKLLLKDSCGFLLLSQGGDSRLASPHPQCSVMFMNLVGKSGISLLF